MLEKELTPVERYAVIFLEKTDEQFSEEAVREAEVRPHPTCLLHLLHIKVLNISFYDLYENQQKIQNLQCANDDHYNT